NLPIQRAAQHRANPTPAERLLWSLLRAKQCGAWFRRQHVLGEFIVDFVALTPRLVVEGAGSAHRTRATADAGGTAGSLARAIASCVSPTRRRSPTLRRSPRAFVRRRPLSPRNARSEPLRRNEGPVQRASPQTRSQI